VCPTYIRHRSGVGRGGRANFAITEFYEVRTDRRPVACTFLCIFGRERLRTTQIGDIEHMLHPVYPWSILRAAFSRIGLPHERSQEYGARAGDGGA
jgi:hypothetical protein